MSCTIAAVCVGGGEAKKCEELGGGHVKLSDAMREHWQKINFSPQEFELKFDDEEEGDNSHIQVEAIVDYRKIKINYQYRPMLSA